MEFEWDPKKAKQNLKKHKTSFDEASTVFNDDLSITFPDPDHSEDEDHLIIIGMSKQKRLLMVAHTERGVRIRIISARELTRTERKDYEEEIQSNRE
ncbi:MAG: BrnT family toxin [Chloroflexota bacterium]